MSTQHPYALLTQDKIMDWLDALGLYSDYRIYPLNSYENRVYRVGIEDAKPIVIKIYRPGRWSEAQIREELAFTQQLFEEDISVVPAMVINNDVLHQADGFYFACFEMRAGHAFELDDADKLYRVGQLLGRLHNFGETRRFEARPHLSLLNPINDARGFFEHSPLMPQDIKHNYLDAIDQITHYLRPLEAQIEQGEPLRIHGDFHAGNILTRGEDILLVDFDDTASGPAMQDIWKLLSGDAHDQRLQLAELEEGYEQFRPFPRQEIQLIEGLRTMHMVKHAFWIAKRWEDPAFPQAFPWFNTPRYWAEHLNSLREQWSVLQDAAD